MSRFIQGLEQTSNRTARTANGAVSNHSSLDSHVDFFSKVGAVRGKDELAWKLFSNAYGSDKLKALKILFYGRDVRGGQGERQMFRSIVTKLASIDADTLCKNIDLFSIYGRWDDLLCLIGTPLEDDAIAVLTTQLEKDFGSDKPSLAAKWTPSLNASSKVTRRNAKKIQKKLGISEKEYRKGLVGIREKLNLLETKMSKKNWGAIDYNEVPSVANVKYRGAFLRNDEDRRRAYLGKVEKGEAKMNTGTLYPYDITRGLMNPRGWQINIKDDKTLELAWKNLPNYLEGNEHNGMVVCDTSGSMFSSYGSGNVQPITVATSLAVYIAERNTGEFKDYFLNFHSNSRLFKLQGATLADKLRNLPWNDWGGSTNIQSAFDNILSVAVAKNLSPDELPQVLYVVSDMQFNHAGTGTNYETIKAKYEAAGYTLPKIVWWNVNASADQPVTIHDENTALVSGCNPNIFEQVLTSSTPVDVMNKTIETERYSQIKV